MDAPAPLTCTDSDRARETSESTRRMEFSERLALTVVPQHFFAARGSTHLSPNIISRDYTGDHRSWWRTTDGWVGKRGSQELWTDRDVAGAGQVVCCNQMGLLASYKVSGEICVTRRV